MTLASRLAAMTNGPAIEEPGSVAKRLAALTNAGSPGEGPERSLVGGFMRDVGAAVREPAAGTVGDLVTLGARTAPIVGRMPAVPVLPGFPALQQFLGTPIAPGVAKGIAESARAVGNKRVAGSLAAFDAAWAGNGSATIGDVVNMLAENWRGEVDSALGTDKPAETVLGGGVRAAARSAPLMVGAMAGGPAGLVAMVGVDAAEVANEAFQERVAAGVNPQQAAVESAAVGAIYAPVSLVLEKTGLDAVLGKMGLTRKFRGVAMRMAARAFVGAGVEGATEWGQGVAADAIGTLLTENDRVAADLDPFSRERLTDFLAGAIMGGVAGGSAEAGRAVLEQFGDGSAKPGQADAVDQLQNDVERGVGEPGDAPEGQGGQGQPGQQARQGQGLERAQSPTQNPPDRAGADLLNDLPVLPEEVPPERRGEVAASPVQPEPGGLEVPGGEPGDVAPGRVRAENDPLDLEGGIGVQAVDVDGRAAAGPEAGVDAQGEILSAERAAAFYADAVAAAKGVRPSVSVADPVTEDQKKARGAMRRLGVEVVFVQAENAQGLGAVKIPGRPVVVMETTTPPEDGFLGLATEEAIHELEETDPEAFDRLLLAFEAIMPGAVRRAGEEYIKRSGLPPTAARLRSEGVANLARLASPAIETLATDPNALARLARRERSLVWRFLTGLARGLRSIGLWPSRVPIPGEGRRRRITQLRVAAAARTALMVLEGRRFPELRRESEVVYEDETGRRITREEFERQDNAGPAAPEPDAGGERGGGADTVAPPVPPVDRPETPAPDEGVSFSPDEPGFGVAVDTLPAPTEAAVVVNRPMGIKKLDALVRKITEELGWEEDIGRARDAWDQPGAPDDYINTVFAPTKDGKLPDEIRKALEGQPPIVRTQFKIKKPGQRAMGEEWASFFGGAEELVRVVAEDTLRGTKNRLAWLRERASAPHPDLEWVLWYDLNAWPIETSQRLDKQTLKNPAGLPVGAIFEIGGIELVVFEDEGGGKRAGNGPGANDSFNLEFVEAIPVDTGTVDPEAGVLPYWMEEGYEAPDNLPPFSAGAPDASIFEGPGDRRDDTGVFGQRMFRPQTGRQNEMFQDTRTPVERELEQAQREAERRNGNDPDQLPLFGIADPIDSPAFRRFFDGSKVVDETGAPKRLFHGLKRPDRVGTRFRKSRATSGPMAFLTDDPEMAGGYATGKRDTSLEPPDDYAGWFLWKGPGQRGAGVPIDRAWYRMDAEQRKIVLDRFNRVTDKDIETGETLENGPVLLPRGETALASKDHWDYTLTREARGNPLRAMVEVWLNSGSLFNDEKRFLGLLAAAGVPRSQMVYNDPSAEYPAIIPVYAAIKNPLETENIPPSVVQALEAAGKRKRGADPRSAVDPWDKRTISGPAWLEALREDIKNGTTMAWTRIPDWVTDTLRGLGYDGIHDTGGKFGGPKHNVWIPFEEGQVKSAISNRGTFDPNNPDIRFAATPPNQGWLFDELTRDEQKQAIEEGRKFSARRERSKVRDIQAEVEAERRRVEQRMRQMLTEPLYNHFDMTVGAVRQATDRARKALQDRFLPARRTQQLLARQGGTVDPESNVDERETTLPGRIDDRVRRFREQRFQPILDLLTESWITRPDADRYLYAKHAPERNAYIASINPEFNTTDRPGSGMTDAEAAEIVAKAESGEQADAYRRLSGLVAQIREFALRQMVADQLMTEDQADAWRRQYEHYVPLRHDDNGRGPGTGRGLDVRGPESKRAFGRRSMAESPLAALVGQAETAIGRGERNRVGLTFLRLVRLNPDPALWEVNLVMRKRALVDGIVSWVPDPAQRNDDSTLIVKEDGQEVRITVHSPALAAAMKNLDTPAMNAMVRMLHGFTRFLASVSTSYSPEFIPTNFARDIQTAVGTALVDFDAKAAIAVARGARSAMWGAYRRLRGQDAGEWGRAFDRFRAEGGMTGWSAAYSIEARAQEIDRLLAEAGPGRIAQTRRILRSVFQWVEDANGAVENAARLSLFKHLTDRGVSDQTAAAAAKNLTVNFNRRGDWGSTLNAVYMFYNASVQGSVRTLQVLLNSRRGRRLMLGLTGFGVAQAMLAAMLSPDDDDGANLYDKIPAWQRAHNLIIPIPGDRKFLMIPLPYGMNLPVAVGVATADIARGRPIGGSLGMVVDALANSFNPLGGNPIGDDAAKGLIQMVTPTVIRPIVESHALNMDFAGRQIRPENNPLMKDRPDSQLYWNGVSPYTREITGWLNRVSGGDEFTPGFLDFNPENIDHLVRGYTGTLGATIVRGIGLPIKMAEGDLPLREIPFVRRFAGEPFEGRHRTQFFANQNEAEMIRYRERQYLETGQEDRIGSIDPAQLEASRVMQGYRRMVTQRSQALAEAEREGDAAAALRLEDELNAIYAEANRAWRLAGETVETPLLDRDDDAQRYMEQARRRRNREMMRDE